MGQQARFIHKGKALDYTPGSDVSGGDVMVIGNDIGLAKLDIAAGGNGALADEGVFDIVKINGAINDRDLVYWDADGDPVGGTAGTGGATTSADGGTNKLIGKCVQAALAGAAMVRVKKLNVGSVSNTIQTILQNAIADPGNAEAIPVTDSGHVPVVTAAAETRTLAAPTVTGQMLSISMKTDGGDCVITCATGINQAGNTTITLNDAGDCILLEAIEVGANKRWRVVRNDGCTLGGP